MIMVYLSMIFYWNMMRLWCEIIGMIEMNENEGAHVQET